MVLVNTFAPETKAVISRVLVVVSVRVVEPASNLNLNSKVGISPWQKSASGARFVLTRTSSNSRSVVCAHE